tara:strand:+ start:5386 stop:6126 length:741 start_codon:yes stop_codon:yes gene_type:complete
MARIFALCTVLLLATGCQTTEETLKKYPVGATYKNVVFVGKKQIPLPKGEWEIFATRPTTTSNGTPLLHLVFGNKDRGASILAIRLTANLGSTSGYGWNQLKACSRTNMHHVYFNEGDIGDDQRCWFANHSRMTRGSSRVSSMTMALDRAKELGIKLPVTSIYAGLRVTDKFDVIMMRVYFNPEADGFDPPQQSAWATNDWHKDRIYTDKKKVAYVERVKNWTEEFFPKVEAGFKGKLVAAQTVPN